ncbi:nickel pincer cofactor biosynthesis protein LarB [Pseudodesulfovibrio sp. F-1]|uniref:Nickel pincer cofactor biosynthesis protein LarB n=1 Tax=Pseudodesulfovibrio alkaliphilus TaxID=2661613 RepID=A0A7K1KNK3_9BACT|nr:nickel pincer cofactor biosynthesis protein LarB [Pseudodesulfovibrio alkaliphilus]MUM77627.1 nickel pincer cofactor biosynthesis protein LarB [Pseudodesulfovibrio alkaliphilus]
MKPDAVLDAFAAGKITREEAKGLLMASLVTSAGCAKLDMHRQQRTGGPEVIYCEGKTPEQVAAIFEAAVGHSGRVLGTRADRKHFEALSGMGAKYDPVSRLIRVGGGEDAARGKVVVVSAGTSDLPVAEEAAGTAEYLGSRVERHFDCGVAGIHRLFAVLDEMTDAAAIIAVAGMEGALPSVLGGLVSPPVIAVPTSVGYGASFQGLAALLTMMNSCSPGVAVVNIDNGFGAGFLAHKINMRSAGAATARLGPTLEEMADATQA